MEAAEIMSPTLLSFLLICVELINGSNVNPILIVLVIFLLAMQ